MANKIQIANQCIQFCKYIPPIVFTSVQEDSDIAVGIETLLRLRSRQPLDVAQGDFTLQMTQRRRTSFQATTKLSLMKLTTTPAPRGSMVAFVS